MERQTLKNTKNEIKFISRQCIKGHFINYVVKLQRKYHTGNLIRIVVTNIRILDFPVIQKHIDKDKNKQHNYY